MEPSLLRQLWQIINETPTQILLTPDVAGLVEQMLLNLAQIKPLSPEENHVVRNYLYSKTSLIQDLACTR